MTSEVFEAVAAEQLMYGGRARPREWPFEAAAWKPSPDDRRRELVKAMALLVAEYERIGRLSDGDGDA